MAGGETLSLGSTLLIGVVSSLFASAAFFLLLWRVRPRIEISKCLAKDGNVVKFKIVNRSRRSAVDVRAQMFVSQKVNSLDGGTVNKLVPVPLKMHGGTIVVLPGFNKADDDYARRIRIDGDLLALWTNDDHERLILRVHARDALSNFGKQFEQAFYGREGAIQNGDFETGPSVEVRPRLGNLPAPAAGSEA